MHYEKKLLEELRREAEELGITLQEYLLLKIVMRLDEPLEVTAHISEE